MVEKELHFKTREKKTQPGLNSLSFFRAHEKRGPLGPQLALSFQGSWKEVHWTQLAFSFQGSWKRGPPGPLFLIFVYERHQSHYASALIAVVTLRWFLAEVPVTRRGRIFPRSETKRRKKLSIFVINIFNFVCCDVINFFYGVWIRHDVVEPCFFSFIVLIVH